MDVSDPVSSQIPRSTNSNPSPRLSNPVQNIYSNTSHPPFQDQPYSHQLHQHHHLPPRPHRLSHQPQHLPTHQHLHSTHPSHQTAFQSHPPQIHTSTHHRPRHHPITSSPPLPVHHPSHDHSHLPLEKLPAPPHRPNILLTQTDSALLVDTYSDFLAPLRKSQTACDWIFRWLFATYPSTHDAARLDIDLSRGFRSIYMCASRGCASLEPSTVIQNVSTLLLPVESSGSVVCGYFTETSTNNVSSVPVRTGKYIYGQQPRELIIVSKVRGPASASNLVTACLSRTCLVGDKIFVKDDVMVSFPWQNYSGRIPDHYIAHSRTLSFHTLLQTAHQAGIEGHVCQADISHLSDSGATFPLSDSSFQGLGAFGLYDVALVPAKAGFGAQAHADDPPQFSFGIWAVPQHSSVCQAHQFLFLGMFAGDLAAMRSQFAQIYGHSYAQRQRQQAHNDVSSSGLDDTPQVAIDNAISGGRRPITRESLSQGLPTYTADPLNYGEKNVVPSYASLPMVVNTSPTVHFSAGSSQQMDSTVLSSDARNRDYAQEATQTAAPIPLGASSLVLPMQRQMTVGSGQSFHGGVDEGLEEVPSSVVESIDAAVGAQTSSTSADRGHTSSPGVKFAPPVVSYAPVLSGATVTGATVKATPPVSLSSSTFKKTLPAPTKNEIVIRNRISAQRSNEKRRRKIEATKNELTYLKSTYLPHLEHKKGTLLSENQSLRMRFMERYESDIESFF